MSSESRDRVTIDLRGIGPAVRAAASARRLRLAAYARLALAEASSGLAAPMAPAPAVGRAGAIVKITLRLDPADAELLSLGATHVGLSYGAFVARLLRGRPMPAPLPDRLADRDALIASTDHLATLGVDLASLVRLLTVGQGEDLARDYVRADSLVVDVRRHLELAARVLAHRAGDR
jgi:hypothetical protein